MHGTCIYMHAYYSYLINKYTHLPAKSDDKAKNITTILWLKVVKGPERSRTQRWFYLSPFLYVLTSSNCVVNDFQTKL